MLTTLVSSTHCLNCAECSWYDNIQYIFIFQVVTLAVYSYFVAALIGNNLYPPNTIQRFQPVYLRPVKFNKFFKKIQRRGCSFFPERGEVPLLFSEAGNRKVPQALFLAYPTVHVQFNYIQLILNNYSNTIVVKVVTYAIQFNSFQCNAMQWHQSFRTSFHTEIHQPASIRHVNLNFKKILALFYKITT